MTVEEEEYANAFAYALLMPERVVVERVRSGLLLADLATGFGVETRTMRTRLVQLGLWDSKGMVPKVPSGWSWMARRFQKVH